jgi:MoaA/NifB/PqqE/SkfB family radical SAM enzyme
MMFTFNRLEIHVANACNLTCESCSHFSNGGHKGILSLKDAETWMKLWNHRIQPATFRLLGGEPLLNPMLIDLLYLSRDCWRASAITLVTNGLLLSKHPNLPIALEECNVNLHISIHDDSPEYREKAIRIDDIVRTWKAKRYFRVEYHYSYVGWTRRHKGIGRSVMPYEDNNPRKSWEICPARECHQLFRGKLWKCAPIAYLRLQKEKYPDLSSAWDPYLAYEGLDAGCSDQELETFLSSEHESICDMCPSNPHRFNKPSPLIPLGKSLGNTPELAHQVCR